MNDAIGERQNSDRALDRLAAQRFLYGRIELVENSRLFLIVLVVALLIAALPLQIELISQGATILVVLLWFIDQVFLMFMGRAKERGSCRNPGGL